MADVPVLELVGVSKTFRRGDRSIHAVRDASISVGRGETVALVGESGSGKSTLGRMALCLIPPDQGRVILNGRCISELSPNELRAARIVMQPVFQDPLASLNPRRRVSALLGQALRCRGVIDVTTPSVRLLEDVGLRSPRSLLSRYPHELSGGQRQRVAIARALAMDPILIIADEPLSGADVSIRGQILNLLADLQKARGVAYLMITHDIFVARAFANRVAVMEAGEIVEIGDANAVLGTPRHPYTRKLVAAVPTFARVPC